MRILIAMVVGSAKPWLMLDVDDQGHVSRLKLLNDPGINLGPIAIQEGFKMTFSPARDSDDHGSRERAAQEMDHALASAATCIVRWIANPSER